MGEKGAEVVSAPVATATTTPTSTAGTGDPFGGLIDGFLSAAAAASGATGTTAQPIGELGPELAGGVPTGATPTIPNLTGTTGATSTGATATPTTGGSFSDLKPTAADSPVADPTDFLRP